LDDDGNEKGDSDDSEEEFLDDFVREDRVNEERERREMRGGLLPPMPGSGVNSVGNVGVAAAAVGVDPAAPVGVAETGEAAVAVPSEWHDTWTDLPIGPSVAKHYHFHSNSSHNDVDPRKRGRLETRVRCAVCDSKSSFQCRECGVY
jgi:hypothetical protein